jgi:serine/threonine-protein kinase
MAQGPGVTLDDDNVPPTSQEMQITIGPPGRGDAASQTLLGDPSEWLGEADTASRNMPGQSDRTVNMPMPTSESGPQAGPVPVVPARKPGTGVNAVPANMRRTVLNAPAAPAPSSPGKIITGSRPRPALEPPPESISGSRPRPPIVPNADPEKVISGSRARPAFATNADPEKVISGSRPRPPIELTEPSGREVLSKEPVSRSGDILTGLKLGEYDVMERVGTGGMSTVYRARQATIGKDVAVKILRTDVVADERDMEQLLQEARTVNAIHHPGIIQIFGAGELPDESGRKYLVMEFLEGESLEQRLERENRIPLREAVPILDDIMSALAAAHQAGVVHRDIKPANIFLIKQPDGKPWVKLVDFGLARPSARREVSRVAGTPDYISPEHARGKPAGPASDIYSLGVMAFVLITGKLPFTGATAHEVMEKHVKVPAPSPLSVDSNVPPSLNALVVRMLEKDPVRRPDGAQVRAELKQIMKQVSTSTSDRNAAAITRDSGRQFDPDADDLSAGTNPDMVHPMARTAPMPAAVPEVTPQAAKVTIPAPQVLAKKERGLARPLIIGLIVLALVAAAAWFFLGAELRSALSAPPAPEPAPAMKAVQLPQPPPASTAPAPARP